MTSDINCFLNLVISIFINYLIHSMENDNTSQGDLDAVEFM